MTRGSDGTPEAEMCDAAKASALAMVGALGALLTSDRVHLDVALALADDESFPAA